MKYINEVATDCYLGSFSNLLNFYGINTTTAYLQLQYGGDICQYIRNSQSNSLKDIKLIHKLGYDIVKNFCTENKIDFCCKELGDKKVAEDYVYRRCKEKKPFLILIGVNHLTYHPYYEKYTRENEHVITILDSTETELYIADCLIPVFPNYTSFEGWVPKEEILKAWENSNFHIFDYFLTGEKLQLRKVDFGKSIATYYENESLGNGFLSFIKDFENYDTYYSEEEQKKNLINVSYNFQFLGPFTFRNSIKVLMNQNCFSNDVLQEYQKYFMFWKTLPFLLVKKGVSPNTLSSKTISEKMLTNYTAEKDFIKKLL